MLILFNRRTLTIGLLAIVCLAGLNSVRLFMGWGPSFQDKTKTMQRDMGSNLAELVDRELDGEGQIMLYVLKHDTALQRRVTAQLKSFTSRLRKSRIELVEVVEVPLVHASDADAITERGIPLDLLKRAKGRDLSALVSLAGGPLGSSRKIQSVAEELPPIICVSYADENLQALIESGVVRAAFVPRRTGLDRKIGQVDRWFDVAFQLVTTNNVKQVYAPH